LWVTSSLILSIFTLDSFTSLFMVFLFQFGAYLGLLWFPFIFFCVFSYSWFCYLGIDWVPPVCFGWRCVVSSLWNSH
jgi:hypothetical protein